MDKEQQRAKTRARVKRYRAKAIRQGVTAKSVTDVTVTPDDVTLECNGTVTPEGLKPEVPANYGQLDCGCRHCAQAKTKREHGLVINHGKYKPSAELAENEINRVSLPGDVDYTGSSARGYSMTEPHREHSQQAAGQAIGAGLVLSRGDYITVNDQAESIKAMAISRASARGGFRKGLRPPSGPGAEK